MLPAGVEHNRPMSHIPSYACHTRTFVINDISVHGSRRGSVRVVRGMPIAQEPRDAVALLLEEAMIE